MKAWRRRKKQDNMDATTTLYYTLALVVAFSLLGLIFTKRDEGPAVTNIVAMDVRDTDGHAAAGSVSMTPLDTGEVVLCRQGLALRHGETVNLVVTITLDKMKIVEKKGVTASVGEERRCEATAMLDFVPQRQLSVRYESEVNGQWCNFSFRNLPGCGKGVEMHC